MILLATFVALIFVGYVLVKRLEMQISLIFAGFFLLSIAALSGVDIMSKAQGGAKNTGYFLFNLFELLRGAFSHRVAEIGLVIMAVGGFSAYMFHIGASQALVRASMRLFRGNRNPYILLVGFFFLNQFLSMVITSAAALGLLLMATEYPLLRNLGISRYSAASIIVAGTSLEFGPLIVPTMFAGQILNMDPTEYFLKHRLLVVLLTMITLAVSHYFWLRFMDKKEAYNPKDDAKEEIGQSEQEEQQAPSYYAIFPILLFVWVMLFNNVTNAYLIEFNYCMNVIVAVFLTVFIAMIIHSLQIKNLKKGLEGWNHFVNGMAKVWPVVTLIIAAGIFSDGLTKVGAVNMLVNGVADLGLGGSSMAIIFSCLVFIIGAMTGSGNAPFLSLAPLIPDIAAQFDMQAVNMLVPSHFASSLGRTVSPIAGVVIACAGMANINPGDIVKRTFIPILIGFICMFFYHILVNGLH